ncbi:MAG: tetratricopeptide repeat protein [Kiritimatiellae bacterium]|nr:tetratricopeptide repeat protein [Kiritimatiellia bacterium]
MKSNGYFVAVLLFAAAVFHVPHAHAESASNDPWSLARAAYDAGRYDEAYRQYEQIAGQPGASAEAQFNAGNAAFRMNDPGRAVLWYRRAERQSPRDPDIRSNQERALKMGGAEPVRIPAADRAFRHMSAAEWSFASVIGCGLACLGLVLWSAIPVRWTGMARRTAIMGGLLWLVAFAGMQSWRRADAPREAIVIERGVRALFAPIPGTTVHFSLPPGSVVRILDQTGEWAKISQASREGWVPTASISKTAVGD